MTAAVNQGSQLNLYVFELGYRTTDPETGLTVTTTAAVHPLVTAPTHVSGADQSRAMVQEVADDSHVIHGGRANRMITLAGTFGVENRGMGVYVGTGPVRAKRFYNEIVRLGEALSKDQVSRAVDILTGSPGISQTMAGFDPDRSVPFINYYDFWDGQYFECVIRNYKWDRNRASATGRSDYTLLVHEVGPIAQTGINQTLIQPLLNGLTLWQSINGVLESYTLEGVGLAVAPVVNIPAAQLADSLEAFLAQKDAATALMGAGRKTDLLIDFFENAGRIESAAQAIASTYKPLPAVKNPGTFDWGSSEDTITTLEHYTEAADLFDVVDASHFQPSAGAFFGMSVDAFQEYITGGGSTGLLGPTVSGALIHTVGPTDTPVTIQQRYGALWSTILEANNLTPREALRRGTELRIPRPRARGDLQINGLPTFDSHQGRSAWGSDLRMDLATDSKGDLALIGGEELLVQGVEVLMADFLERVVRGTDRLVEAVAPIYIAERYRQVLLSDQRTAAVASITVDPTSAGYEVAATISAINGGTIRAGA